MNGCRRSFVDWWGLINTTPTRVRPCKQHAGEGTCKFIFALSHQPFLCPRVSLIMNCIVLRSFWYSRYGMERVRGSSAHVRWYVLISKLEKWPCNSYAKIYSIICSKDLDIMIIHYRRHRTSSVIFYLQAFYFWKPISYTFIFQSTKGKFYLYRATLK